MAIDWERLAALEARGLEARGEVAPDYTAERTYASTRAPVEQARTLLPDAYRDPAYHAVEQRRLFRGSWVAVGTIDAVREPGGTMPVTVAGQPLVVTRGRDGVLRGFHNVCRHRGAKLVVEPCELKRFRCPYHSWTYALDGRLLGAPLFEGSPIPEDQQGMFEMGEGVDLHYEEHGLLPVATQSWGHLVFVSLDPDVPPLETWLGDLPERLAGYRLEDLHVVAERQYDVAANWKLIAENFMEYYHLPWVHPELVKISRIEDHHRFQGPGMYTGMCTSPISRSEEGSAWSILPETADLPGDDAVSGRFVWILPNVALAVLPNHVFTLIADPLAPDRTVEHTSISVPATTPTEDADVQAALAELAGFWDHVNGEDIEIIERVQAGMRSAAYPGGRMCYRFEEPLHRFQNMVIDRLVGVERIPPGDGDAPMFARRPDRWRDAGELPHSRQRGSAEPAAPQRGSADPETPERRREVPVPARTGARR